VLSLDGHACGRHREEDVMGQQRALAFAIAVTVVSVIGVGTAQGTAREASPPARLTASTVASRLSVRDLVGPNAVGKSPGGAPPGERAHHTIRMDWSVAGDPRAFVLDTAALARRSGWPGPPNYIGCRDCEIVRNGGVSEAMLDRSQ
jgi:hypothetical protein